LQTTGQPAHRRFIDVSRKIEPIECERILRDLPLSIDGSVQENFQLRLPSQFGSSLFSDIWTSILVGTLCRQRQSELEIVSWGHRDWDPTGQFARSLPGITALQLSDAVFTDQTHQRIQVKDVDSVGVLEDMDGKNRTLIELDPQRPVAAKLAASTSDQQAVLFRNLIRTFRHDLELGYRNRGIAVHSRGEIGSLTQFLTELHENSYRYARSPSTEEKQLRGLRFVRLRAHLAANREDLVRRAHSSSPVRTYLEQIARGAGAHGVMEAVVSDFGSGILDHFLSSARGSAYHGQDRRLLLHKLIHENLSSSTNPSAGLGLPKVLKAAKSLSAFVSVRTAEFWLAQSFSDPSASARLDDVGQIEKTRISGTHWQFLWPMGL
jgi:hypothetical protein